MSFAETTSQEIGTRLPLLKSDNAETRNLAAAEIGDYLEADHLDKDSLAVVLRPLMAFALAETDEAVKETLFRALSTAAEVGDVPGIDWSPIAARLDELPADCLEHALGLLGFSGNPKYRNEIKRFSNHPDEDVRRTAADALAVLEGLSRPRKKVPAGHPKRRAQKKTS